MLVNYYIIGLTVGHFLPAKLKSLQFDSVSLVVNGVEVWGSCF